MAYRQYRITSDILEVKRVESISKDSDSIVIPAVSRPVSAEFYIEKQMGWIIRWWKTVATEFEHTDETNTIKYRKFKTYDEAEAYLFQKYANPGNYMVKRLGNIYRVSDYYTYF